MMAGKLENENKHGGGEMASMQHRGINESEKLSWHKRIRKSAGIMAKSGENHRVASAVSASLMA